MRNRRMSKQLVIKGRFKIVLGNENPLKSKPDCDEFEQVHNQLEDAWINIPSLVMKDKNGFIKEIYTVAHVHIPEMSQKLEVIKEVKK